MEYEQQCENGEWPTPTGTRVITLANDGAISFYAISGITGVPESSVRKIVESGSVRHSGRDRPVRPPILSSEQIDKVIDYLGHNFEHRILSWKGLVSACSLECSPVTLKTALAARGFHKCVACPKPFISESARQQRLLFITEHSHWSWQWEEVIWSDESTFYTGKQRKAMVIRTNKERYCSYTCQNRYRSGRTSFAIWAAVGWNYKSPLVFLEGHGARGGCTKKDYIQQVLKPVVAKMSEDTLQYYGYPLLYQEDGNRIHGLTGAQNLVELKEKLGIRAMNEWPASSPDFNPIEQVWRSLKQRLGQRGPWLRLADLKAALQEEYDKMSQDEIRGYIRTMPARIREGKERNGWATSY